MTRVGRFLRAARLDEFPQLVNITRGEMSFIGPRPERPEFESDLEANDPPLPVATARQTRPHGLGADQERLREHDPRHDRKLEYDLYYIKNRSLRMDLQILAGTLFTLLGRRGR